jgi:hypothetical protein
VLGASSGSTITSGSGVNLIGKGVDGVTTGSNITVIGRNINPVSPSEDNQLNIQNIIYGRANEGTGTTVSTGRIGIGSTAPAARLHVKGVGTTSSTSAFKVDTGDGTNALLITDNNIATINATLNATNVVTFSRVNCNVYINDSSGTQGSGLYIKNNDVLVWGIHRQADQNLYFERHDAAGNYIGPAFRIFFNSGVWGYGGGHGGIVTQLTSKATAVQLDKPCGQINTAADSLAANTMTYFTFTNSAIVFQDDRIDVWIARGGTLGAYTVKVLKVNTGSCIIGIKNDTAGALAESLVLGFMVIKMATA